MPNKINFENIQDAFTNSTYIQVINNNKNVLYDKESKQYYEILNCFNKLLENSHQVPALGVSIDNLTRQELKNGLWLEFNFNKTFYNFDMPFESLLVKIEPESYGLNIIRKYKNKYEGRVYYINLEQSTNQFIQKINLLI